MRFELQRRSFGCPLGLRFKELMNAEWVGIGALRLVPLNQQLSLF